MTTLFPIACAAPHVLPEPRQGSSVLGGRPSEQEWGDITECRRKRARKQGLELLRWADTTFPASLEFEVEDAQHRLSHLSFPAPGAAALGRADSSAQRQEPVSLQAHVGQGRKRGPEDDVSHAQAPQPPARDCNARAQLMPPPHMLLASYPVLNCGPTPAYHSMAIVPFDPARAAETDLEKGFEGGMALPDDDMMQEG
ncbi:hypothetical protein ACKKBG_A28785 [Auxenochlorella protothecoides x Auxenochlorella symbiontica]